jgi:hypothetical protein
MLHTYGETKLLLTTLPTPVRARIEVLLSESFHGCERNQSTGTMHRGWSSYPNRIYCNLFLQ